MNQNPYVPPSSTALPEAPGAKAARHCGIWAIISMFLCFPVSLVLGIIAIVNNNKAKETARNRPGTFQVPSNAGLIMGIISLAIFPILIIIGLISAIAIPALLGQRGRARDKAAVSNMVDHMNSLVGKYDVLMESRQSNAEVHQGLEAFLQERASHEKNPWSIATPSFSYSIAVVSGLDKSGAGRAAEARATELGQGVFVIQFPSSASPRKEPGLLAGAVKTQSPVNNGRNVVVEVVDLD